MDDSIAIPLLTLGALAWLMPKAVRRLELSRAKHRSLAGHARMAKRVAGLLPGYAYNETQFFSVDGASAAVVQRRRDIVRRRIVVTLSAALARAVAERVLAYVHGARLRGRPMRPVSQLLVARACVN